MSPKPRTEFAPPDQRRDRGQTTLDFAIGMSVFLIAVAFVFSFIPGMLQPFTGSNEAKTVVADRVADSLAEGMLGHPTEPYILDSDCTVAFFDPSDDNTDNDGSYDYAGNGDVPGGCTFADVPMRDRLGLEGRNGENGPRFNVTIVEDYNDQDGPSSTTNGYGLPSDGTEETLCVDNTDEGDGSDYWFVDASTEDSRGDGDECDLPNANDFLLAAGGTPPQSGSVVTARRVVRIEGPSNDIDATLYVRVW
jgi:hypothetical protein